MNTSSAYLLQQMPSGTLVDLHLSTESPCQVFVDTCNGLTNKSAQNIYGLWDFFFFFKEANKNKQSNVYLLQGSSKREDYLNHNRELGKRQYRLRELEALLHEFNNKCTLDSK